MKYDEVPFNPGYGVEPPCFAGRELVAQTILLGLQRGPGREEFLNIVTGGRGTGKTTLLDHLRRYVTSEWGWSTMKWAGRPSWSLAQLLAEEAPRIEHELRSPLQKVRSALRPAGLPSTRKVIGSIPGTTFIERQDAPARQPQRRRSA